MPLHSAAMSILRFTCPASAGVSSWTVDTPSLGSSTMNSVERRVEMMKAVDSDYFEMSTFVETRRNRDKGPRHPKACGIHSHEFDWISEALYLCSVWRS